MQEMEDIIPQIIHLSFPRITLILSCLADLGDLESTVLDERDVDEGRRKETKMPRRAPCAVAESVCCMVKLSLQLSFINCVVKIFILRGKG